MNCPACSHALTPLSVGELTVDACEGGCGGVWFDHYELRKVDEPSEALGDQLLDVQRDPSVVVDPSKRYDCPKCNDGVVMMRHFWSVRREITIDECPECGGIFLDAGELAKIRTEFPSHEAKEAAADSYFHATVDPVFDAARAADHLGPHVGEPAPPAI
ncbi:MAG TPA: zf-TFIIB domain-containing protein [Gaiellaceae bacterium]|nr:zf-TFIIB domain-containing protein [Gaiellaceae bacterium]